MASPIQNPTTSGSEAVPLDSFIEDIPPLSPDDGVMVGNEVRIGRGAQPAWLRGWILFLIVWSFWYFFVGGQGLFHAEGPVNWFFTVVVALWTIYHYILVPRFKWPPLPLG